MAGKRIDGYVSPLAEKGSKEAKTWRKMKRVEKQATVDLFASSKGQGMRVEDLGKGLTGGAADREGIMRRLAPDAPKKDTRDVRIAKIIAEEQVNFGIDTSLPMAFIEGRKIAGVNKKMPKGAKAGFKGKEPWNKKPQFSGTLFDAFVIEGGKITYFRSDEEMPGF